MNPQRPSRLTSGLAVVLLTTLPMALASGPAPAPPASPPPVRRQP